MKRFVKTGLAICVPAACFMGGLVLARLQSQSPAEPLTEATHIVKHSLRGATATEVAEELAEVDDWNLVSYREKLGQLSAAQLREFIQSQAGTAPLDRLMEAAKVLGRVEGEAAVEYIAGLADLVEGFSHHHLVYEAIGGWAEVDPRGALNTTLARKDENLWEFRVLQHVIENDPRLAAELMELPEVAAVGSRGNLLYQLGTSMAGLSTEDALHWYGDLSEADRSLVGKHFFKKLAETNPKEAAGLIAQMPAGQMRTPAMEIASQWSASDPETAIEWTESMPQNDLAWDARRAGLMVWADADPTAAWEYLRGLDSQESRALLEEKLGQDIQQAIREQRPHNLIGDHLRAHGTFAAALLDDLSGEQANGLLKMMRESTNSEVRQQASAHDLFELSATDPAGAAQRAGEIGDKILPSVLEPYFYRLAATDPQGAMELALAFPTRQQGYHIYPTMKAWAEHDPDGAYAQIESMDPGRARETAFDAYADKRMRLEPERVAEKLSEQLAKDDTQRSSLPHGLITHWFGQDPQAAGEWAVAIEQPRLRGKAIGEIYQHWSKFGAEIAQQRLEALGLSVEEIEAAR